MVNRNASGLALFDDGFGCVVISILESPSHAPLRFTANDYPIDSIAMRKIFNGNRWIASVVIDDGSRLDQIDSAQQWFAGKKSHCCWDFFKVRNALIGHRLDRRDGFFKGAIFADFLGAAGADALRGTGKLVVSLDGVALVDQDAPPSTAERLPNLAPGLPSQKSCGGCENPTEHRVLGCSAAASILHPHHAHFPSVTCIK